MDTALLTLKRDGLVYPVGATSRLLWDGLRPKTFPGQPYRAHGWAEKRFANGRPRRKAGDGFTKRIKHDRCGFEDASHTRDPECPGAHPQTFDDRSHKPAEFPSGRKQYLASYLVTITGSFRHYVGQRGYLHRFQVVVAIDDARQFG